MSIFTRSPSWGWGFVSALVLLPLPALAQPANNDCGNAVPVGNGIFNFTTFDATTDSPAQCANGRDVWFAYTAPTSSGVQVDTCTGTAYDSVVAVFTGSCGALTVIQCNDDSCDTQSVVQFAATQGVTYLISVGGWNGELGTGMLRIGGGPAPTQGADVALQEINSMTNWGAVGGIHGYSLGSTTCNLGDTDLPWEGDTNHHLVLSMNLYRLYQGRLEQVGLSWLKNATNAGAFAGCGLPCNGHGGRVLGAGCQDIYGSSGNGDQAHLGPRSDVNAHTGFYNFPFPIGQPTGNAIYKRCQVHDTDLSAAQFPGALYFMEGVFVTPEDAQAGNSNNNASYRRVTVAPGSLDLNLTGTTRWQFGAIHAWQDHGGGVNVPDPNVQIVQTDVPGEGRFTIAARAFDNGNGTWRYEYAVFNLSSDRSGGSFLVPVGPGTAVTNVGFHDVDYHSGDPFDNTDWNSAVTASGVFWSSPQTFAQNPNSNALRWGTLYNFRFTAAAAPAPGTVTLGLFKPGSPTAVTATVPVPSGAPGCRADWNHDSTVNSQDFFDFLAAFFNNNADFNFDGVTNSQDFFDFLAAFFNGC